MNSDTAKDERRRANALFRSKKNWQQSFSYEAYGDPSVREALEQMFRMKCAYCETKIGAADEAEVEHWRPKGAVKEREGARSYPGYYWLASEWDNLLLSCLKCNRPRKYRIPGGEEDDATWVRTGKAMFFPLRHGDVRATRKGREKRERPLLLNPCRDTPDTYLSFVVVHDDPDAEGTVGPKSRPGRRHDVAVESIDIYSLNRPLLVEARREKLRALQRLLSELRRATNVYDAMQPGPARDEQDLLIKSQLEGIGDFFRDEAEYLLMARQTLAAFLRQEPRLLNHLRDLLRR